MNVVACVVLLSGLQALHCASVYRHSAARTGPAPTDLKFPKIHISGQVTCSPVWLLFLQGSGALFLESVHSCFGFNGLNNKSLALLQLVTRSHSYAG